MTKITHIGPTECDTIRGEIARHLAPMEEQYGVKFDLGRLTYDHSGAFVSGKLTCTVVTGGVAQTKELAELEKRYPQLIDTHFEYKGKTLTVVGYNTRAHKMPFKLQDVNSGHATKCSKRFLQAVIDAELLYDETKPWERPDYKGPRLGMGPLHPEYKGSDLVTITEDDVGDVDDALK